MKVQVYKQTDLDEQVNPYPLLYMSLPNTSAKNHSDREGLMNTPTLETERLILRKFTSQDMDALFLILQDEEVNRFLP